MSFSVSVADERVQAVEFTNEAMSVSLLDGRTISVPLAWYPRLLNATLHQRRNWRIAGGGYGIHWPDVDEDLSTEGLLRGAAAPNRSGQREELGRIDLSNLPKSETWLPLGPTRPSRPSALYEAQIDALEQIA